MDILSKDCCEMTEARVQGVILVFLDEGEVDYSF